MLYCTVESGYQAGLERLPYREVCFGEGDVAFRQGYERGRADRPNRPPVRPAVGVGVSVGSGGGGYGGIGLGFPFYSPFRGYSDGRGFPYFHGYCFYNAFECERRGWR